MNSIKKGNNFQILKGHDERYFLLYITENNIGFDDVVANKINLKHNVFREIMFRNFNAQQYEDNPPYISRIFFPTKKDAENAKTWVEQKYVMIKLTGGIK
ncbi:MAG: hypothetical protein ACOCP8_07850 [archaeon]